MNLDNIINGENFKNLAQIIIEDETIHQIRNYQKKNIVFCKSNYLPNFFAEIMRLDISIILITHQSDYEVNENEPNIQYEKVFQNGEWKEVGYLTLTNKYDDTPALIKLKPPQVKMWFAQNVNCHHPQLTPIPIGIPNHKGNCVTDKLDVFEFVKYPEPSIELFNKKDKRTDLIYCNINPTHPLRYVCSYILDKSGIGFDESSVVDNKEQDFAPPSSIVQDSSLNYNDYLKRLDEFLFVACPRGNGIDTFRVWETLLMGSIPIVIKHHMYDNYDLPIWQVDSWLDVLDKSKLNHWVEKYKSGNLFQNVSSLTMDYWKSRIFDEYNKMN